jgi:hypothetical protein
MSRYNQFGESVVIEGNKTVEEIISDLKFISKIKEGEILNTQNDTLTQEGWSTSIWRTFIYRRESRKVTLEFFRYVTNEALVKLSCHLSDKNRFNQELGIMIFDALRESREGIENHKKTYISDQRYASDIESFLLLLDVQLKEYKKIVDTILNNQNN